MKIQYQNRLPHIAPVGATFFVTFRLADSLPQSIINELKAELEAEVTRLKKEFPGNTKHISDARKRNFGKFDHQLDTQPYGACHLKTPEVAEILIKKLEEYNGSLYDLHAFSIMPNHAHILFSMATQVVDGHGDWPNETPGHYVQLDKVMHLIKGGSSYSINKLLGRTGKLWCKDSYDHFVRKEEEWLNIANYILQNPVKAGLVKKWETWLFNYCKPSVLDHLLFRN